MHQILLLTPAVERSFLFRRVLLLLFLFALWETPQAAIPEQRDELLQFTASGHVLGFQSDGYYVANGDHMLHVGFVGSTGVAPESASATKNINRTQPLNKVTYTNLWPGINLRYEANDKGILESIWEISAGASPEQIRLRYNTPMKIAADGSLKIEYRNGWMSESAPIAWQVFDGTRHPVEVAFHLVYSSMNETVIKFELGHYDPDHPLLIDPDLTWNTFMGSTSDRDDGDAIAMDSSGNIYIVGNSNITWGTPVNAHSGGLRDAFAAKFDSNGNRIWHTFMGSVANDVGADIAVNNNGVTYVTGWSDGTWGGRDAFVVKLNTSGERLWYGFFGSEGDDYGQQITLDNNGNVYVIGSSNRTWGSPISAYKDDGDAFVIKLDSNGGLVWNTFIGSTNYDAGRAIAVDDSNNVYVSGTSDATWGNPINNHKGGRDVFVAKLDTDGQTLWNTFLGTSDSVFCTGISVDASGNLFVGGWVGASWGAPVNAYMGGYDVFVAKLDAIDGHQIWNTFMGSANDDYGGRITVDNNGNAFVAGYSNGSWGRPINTYRGDSDAFAAKLDAEGVLEWNIFMGSDAYDTGSDVVVDNVGKIFVAGNSYAEWGEPVNHYAGAGDAFISKPNTTRCTLIIFKSRNGKSIPMCL